MNKDKILQLEVAPMAQRIGKKKTLLEILKILEASRIQVIGNVKRDRKKDILRKSLNKASQAQASKFLELTGSDGEASKGISRPIVLHPLFIGTKVEKFFNLGEYGESVRVAFIRVNNRVKKITGLRIDGAPLMRQVFSQKKPLIAFNNLSNTEECDEQEGLMHIFEGSMLAFRNPPSHDDELELQEEEARLILGIADYLMKLLDSAGHA